MNLTGENILLIGSVLLFGSIWVGKTGSKFGIPILLLFLLVGMLVGVDGLGIRFNSPSIAQFIGIIALIVILFSGGMNTRFTEIGPVLVPGILLSTVGVILTAVLVGCFLYGICLVTRCIPFTFAESLLLGAVISSTDSASVFSLLGSFGRRLTHHLRPLLELESGSNDPMAYLLTILMINVIQGTAPTVGSGILVFVLQLSVGLGAGYFLGWGMLWGMNHLDVSNRSFYAISLLAFVFFTFSITTLLQGNGYLAVYIAGLVVGNRKMAHKRSLVTFFDGFAWLFQIVMFLSLGLLVNPRELIPVACLGLLVGFFLIFVARPLMVFGCLLPFRNLTVRAKSYVSWVGLRGAVPIIFATYPLLSGVERAPEIFNLVFFITILSLIVQGATVGWMAKRLGVSEPEEGPPSAFNLEFSEEIKSALSEIEVTAYMLENRRVMMDLPLPDNTLVVMVKRGPHFFIPTGQTRLFVGDKLLVITDNDEELRRTFENLGIQHYLMRKNEA